MRAVLAVFAAALSATALGADVSRSKSDADQMLRKIAVITAHGLNGTGVSARLRPARQTPVTEREVNSYLVYHAKNEIPAGVVDPAVGIGPDGRLTGRAVVDLDQVRQARASEGFSVLALLSGRLPIEASGTLQTANGRAQFLLERATVSGVPVPKTLLQEVVSYYSRTPDNPGGIDIDAPFELPVGIREIRTQAGQAIVVQ